MPGNTEEKEKRLEKLNQMQKFIPFLDFMIEKISQTNNEILLECQLNKLQILRSMIAEKSEKYSWENIIKVEDVIQRLISKLDVKERYGKNKGQLDDADSENRKTSMATSISTVPSSTTNASVTTTSDSLASVVGVKSPEFSNSTVDLIMKTLKTPIEQNKITDRDKELLSKPLGPNQPLDVSGKPMETDLDKDLDGYDLIECPSLSETNSSNTATESVPEKVTSRDDLLSSSREKLFKSLQSRLFPCRTNVPSSQSLAGDKTEKKSERQITSAFSRSQMNVCEQKAKSDFSESSDNKAADKKTVGPESSHSTPGKHVSCGKTKSSEKTVTSSVENPNVNLKQRLKEKLSTYVGEVYRIPGKSVGGSLRSLKESRDPRKSLNKEELFKPDIINSGSQSRSSAKCKDSSTESKPHHDSTENQKKGESNSDKASLGHSTGNSEKDKWRNTRSSKTSENESKGRSHKDESNRGNTGEKSDGKSSTGSKKPPSTKLEDKGFELDKLNDEELLEFVKENMQSLPRLAKLESSELRKAVQSTLCNSFAALDADAVSEISDGSFYDSDDSKGESKTTTKTVAKDKSESKEPHPLASEKMTAVGSDGVAKSVKSIVEPSKDIIVSEEVGDNTRDTDDVSLDDSNMNEDDYVMKLIEDTTPKLSSQLKKKESFDLPLPAKDDLFAEISVIESLEPSSSPSENRDPRLTKLSTIYTARGSNKLQNSSDLIQVPRDIWDSHPASLPKDSNRCSKPQSTLVTVNIATDRTQRSNQDRFDPTLSKPFSSRCPQDVNQYPQSSYRYPNDSKDPRLRSANYGFHNYNPRYHTPSPSEPRSYAEYKRMKQKEQEKLGQVTAKDNPKSSFSDGSDVSRSFPERGDGNTTWKNQDPRYSKSQQYNRGFRGRTSGSYSKQWRYPNQPDSWERKSVFEESWDDDDKSKKTNEPERKTVFEESWDDDDKPKKANEKRYSSNLRERSVFEESWDDDDKPKKTEEKRYSSNLRERSVFEESWDDDDKPQKTEEKRYSSNLQQRSVFEESWDDDDKPKKAEEKRHSSNLQQRSVFEESWDDDDKPKKTEEKRHSSNLQERSVFEESWDDDDKPKKTEEKRHSSNLQERSVFEESWDDDDKPKKTDAREKKTALEESWDDDDKPKKADEKCFSSNLRERSVFEESWDDDDKPKKTDAREKKTVLEESWDDDKPKKTNEKRFSSETKELVSPLEELYPDDDKPKTGRGYGIQNFKIPKKVRQTPFISKKNQVLTGTKGDARTEASNTEPQVDSTKRMKDSKRIEESEKSEINQVNVAESAKESDDSRVTLNNSTASEDVPGKRVERVETSVDNAKTDASCNESKAVGSDIFCEKTKSNENPASESVTIPCNTNIKTSGHAGIESKPDSDNTDALERNPSSKSDVEEPKVITDASKAVTEKSKTCEAQMDEWDSSMESSSLNTSNSRKDSSAPSDKNTTAQKEEITQEFVEALIRKSFQSGEGKLLLAQVKLFEEFARKLNSKKLKTIQKIINSESGSSSSSSESSSDDEKRKKKSKKSEQKSKKRKKKGRKSRKYRFITSSSSSESEVTSEDESCDKKEASTKTKRNDSSPDNPTTSEEVKAKVTESGVKVKGNKKPSGRRVTENRCLSPLQQEGSNPENPDISATKKRTSRATELDRLHDDIRSMFISAGVVTATGRRMCRILKQSGGNMNNLDIVKESAKMVEEEKLKRVQTRGSKSQPSDKEAKAPDTQYECEEVDPKLRLLPHVALQRVDLDNFGYGIKVSEDCISFRRMKGRNTAIRGAGTKPIIRQVERSRSSSPVRNVFLARNKRKFERLKDSNRKKVYRGKKLMDIVKNLPLKMAKMKHLQIVERKTEAETTKTKLINKSEEQTRVGAVDLSNSELQCYAFEKRRKIYICKLCCHVSRNITGHYKAVHTQYEILISRLCLKEAKLAKLESQKYNYDLNSTTMDSLENSTKRKAKPSCNTSNVYICRMCCFSKASNVNGFACHVTSHTGEYPYLCPSEECCVQVHSREKLKFHILAKHSERRYELYSKIKQNYAFTIEGNKLFGYLCSLCHFVQMCRCNLERHISIQHHSFGDAKIIKINMSSRRYGGVRKNPGTLKNGAKEAPPCSNKVESDKETHNSDAEVPEVKIKKSDVLKNTKKRQRSENEFSEGHSNGSGTEVVGKKRIFLQEVSGKLIDAKVNAKCLEKDTPVEGDEDSKIDMEGDEDSKIDMVGDEDSKIDMVGDEDSKIDMEGDEDSKIDMEGDEDSKIDMEGDEDSKIDVEGDEDSKIDLEGDEYSKVDVEDCVDLKSISNLKGSDIICSMETPEMSENSVRSNPEISIYKLKVGPLAALLSPNTSEILYECFVKGCLFSTRAYDLFEKHIKISHSRTKWNGVCELCCPGKDNIPLGKNPFKLLTALNHLKLHAKNGKGKLSKEDLIMELKLLTPTEECVADDEDSDTIGAEDKGKTVKEQMAEKTESSESSSYPPKPLLRVRNLLGDRLSTPKGDESDVVAITEDDSSNSESTSDSSKMFTIENVRSLTGVDSPAAESEFKIEQVCSLKELVSKPASQLNSGKTILVRSCPTRKIAIRPEPSALSVDVGSINVVQPPVVAHPVVLSPLTNTSPIRIISTALPANPTFSVKPIMVAADNVRLTSPNLMPVIAPSIPPTVTSTTLIPVSVSENPRINVESKIVSQKQENSAGEDLLPSKIGLDVEVIASPTRSKSPGNAATVHHLSKTSSSDVEDVDDKDVILPHIFASSPNPGKKSVKDVKIYKEMLTKTKLCHLFKCMGIECSFTCNNENVFTQHIGLHDAQRRLKRNKGMKMIYLRSANKTTRAFYWQQCAYCCEVLSVTNNSLSHHILEEHGHCMYQCAFCFYRAVSHSYVEIHQNLAHSQILKTTSRVIYKCKPLKVPPSQTVALEKHGRKQSVRPYHCDQCGRKFYITHEFTTHLQTEHQSVTAYTCHICKNLCFKVNRLINHYKLHSYSTYQCAYCLHGTETEREMVFHLCNFHFSQPAVMYIRALAEGQSIPETKKPNKKKKHLSNQLESLKVIVYESENPNLDCIVEADPDEEIPENISESSLDLSSIVAELGIATDSQSAASGMAVPLIKELASIGDRSTKHLTVKTLLPNAQFSSENENGSENCSVLISSGLSIPSDPEHEREMNIPLGQLPLEAVNVQHKEKVPSSSVANNIGSPDKNLKLSEIIVNLQHKDKNLTLPEEEKIGQPPVKHSTAVHKLPPVLVDRDSVLKYAYPAKSAVLKKKTEESPSVENAEGDTVSGKSGEKEGNVAEEKSEDTERNRKHSSEKQTEEDSNKQPLITNVVSLSNREFDKEQPRFEENSIIISDVCSLSTPSGDNKDNSSSSPLVINIKSAVNVGPVLKPPIIRLEDFPMDEDIEATPTKNSTPKVECKDGGDHVEKKPEETRGDRPSSPDVIILDDQKGKEILTVTLDSDDEKEENVKKQTKKKSKESNEAAKFSTGNETIRKEMELLRNQIANETDSLLLDETEAEAEAETEKPSRDLSLDINPEEDSNSKTLLSPIEEAICSLNKKLESENQKVLKKVEKGKKGKAEAAPRGPDGNENKVPERPRTRFGRRKECAENAEKSDGDDGVKKEPGVKFKRFKGELMGKDLFICGNDRCDFAAENDSSLKDHLYVCDLSRDSSLLVCPHCSRQIKQFHPYLEHLKSHGEKRFHCGLCQFSSAVELSASNHVKQKHKCSATKILPKESKEGHMVYYPKNYRVEKVDFEVNGYSPGDEDKLPLQSVYQVNVKCAKCPYFTKVRSNMVRHLKIHVKSVETEGVVVVPSTAPTNPVPCLETKERMFDKMTNLAASSQLAQAKDKTVVESLSPEEEVKLPQFVAEQMRYKCCLPDCNYITVDDGMLKHHIKALHDEISYYSCPHCRSTVHVDVRHVILDKIGFHLRHHDNKLYKCPHCIYFHYQKSAVEKHTAEKHPDRRYFVHVVREPKVETTPEEESSSSEGGIRVWKCGLCNDFQTPSKISLMDHLCKTHNTKSKYKCKFCAMKGNSYQAFMSHFASKHPGEKMSYLKVYYSEKVGSVGVESQSGNSSGADSSNEHFDTTPLWQRGAPRIRHIRGILIEEEEIKTKKSKKASSASEAETSGVANLNENAFYCPLCTNKKKPFYTRLEDCFRTHLYQELNYQQFACILCGKMFVDRKDFEKHHSRVHTDKAQSLKQTKEDHEIKFWVDQVIAKQRKQMEERKRKRTDSEESGEQAPRKRKREI